MYNILQFLLVVFIVAVGIVALVIWLAWRKIHKAMNGFGEQLGGGKQSRQDSYRQRRTTTTGSGETIIDTRSPEQTQRKIFSKDEGEYVDYKEIKE